MNMSAKLFLSRLATSAALDAASSSLEKYGTPSRNGASMRNPCPRRKSTAGKVSQRYFDTVGWMSYHHSDMKNPARHSTSCLAQDLNRSCMDVQHRPLVSIRLTQHSRLPLRRTSFSILFHTCQAQLQDLVPLSSRLRLFVSLLKRLLSIFTLPCRLRLKLLARYA